MIIRIAPGTLRGEIQAPPSKSYAHRLLLAAGLARGESILYGVEQSGDLKATEACLTALGAEIRHEKNAVILRGSGKPIKNAVFPAGESATTLRFFLPLALKDGGEAVFSVSPRLKERGIGVYETLFREKGIKTTIENDFIRVTGRLEAGEYRIRGDVSSQFASGLLFALPLLKGESRLTLLPPVESRPYIAMTLDVLNKAEIVTEECAENIYRVPGGQSCHTLCETVEGDWSNGAVFLALASLGHAVGVTGLREESLQGDRAVTAFLKRLEEKDPVIDLSDTPDLAPILFAAAAAKNGAVFTGTRRLGIKESDRAKVMAEELKKCGVEAAVGENRVTVVGGTLHAPAERLSAHGDHRVAMALAALLTLVGGELEGAEAVGKSWPGFWEALEKLGAPVRYL